MSLPIELSDELRGIGFKGRVTRKSLVSACGNWINEYRTSDANENVIHTVYACDFTMVTVGASAEEAFAKMVLKLESSKRIRL